MKRVCFPVEILPVAALAAALTQLLLGLIVVAVVAAACGCVGHWTWLPIALIPYAAFLLGVAWTLAALGPFFRDLGPAVVAGSQLLLFLTPVFYPLSAVPARWQFLVLLNPVAIAVESFRHAVLNGPEVGLPAAAGLTASGVVMMILGYAAFMRLKPAMADVV